ncbi:hypothetical protein PMAYCL1PPCAC_06935 [Pristionchus mayeri]|uniref:ABC transporter ATP-binding protein n=1 Tax=Pristionchus mayeri TaxID=1317129 RepID=A0AAN5CAF4_9BILA|nr:hypothetical protein PMAYCL1PPCAC_06935 [Pristionchus mayeri]
MGESTIFCNDPLWVSFNGSKSLPNFTTCFQHTVLTYVPFGFLLVLFPILMIQSSRIRYRFGPLPWTPLLILRMLISLYLAGNSVAVFVLNTFILDGTHTVDMVYPLVWTLFFMANIFIDWNRRRCGQVSSGIQHLSFFLLFICTTPELYYRIQHEEPLSLFILFMGFWPVIILQNLLYCWADARSSNEKAEKSDELDSSFLNRLTIWWFTSLPFKGAKKDLDMHDLFELNYGSSSEYLGSLFEKYWEPAMKAYLEKKAAISKNGESAYGTVAMSTPEDKVPSEPSLILALFRMFKYEFLTASLLKVLSDTLQFANPFLLNQLIGFVSSPQSPFWQGISYAILMFAVSECRSIIINAYFYIMFRMGIKIQTALTAAVYRKTMRLSAGARREKTVGEIINLMAIDVDFFQMITPQIQQFWSCPYQIIFALVYLFLTLGYSASPGVVIMVLFVPINIVGSIIIKKWQMRQMKLKDERTKMVNEVLNGIKVIKLYAWEVPMEEHINSIRERELALIKKSQFVKNMIDTFNTASPFMVAAASFGTFILSSDLNILTPQIAFVSLTLFNQLRSPMTMVAMLMNMLVQAIVSNRRLKSFFTSEELDDSNVTKNPNADSSLNSVEFSGVDAAWDEHDSARATLRDINAVVKRGSFISVVGTVGCGKSSLLSAMLGELTRVRGEIRMNGRVAYVPQQAWIQNLSVRDNITFGKPFNRKWYDKVIFSCALAPDFAILPHGDLTEIGEKGINLSGGQKARISLARAVYQQDDVYLLDDPLSAVDAHVGRHIFNHVIGPSGLLSSKTRVLVTHGLTYTRDAEEILVMSDGVIIERGGFESLLKVEGVFSKLMEEYAKSSSDEEDDESINDIEEFSAKDLDESKDREDTLTRTPEKESGEEEKKLIQKEGVEQGRVKSRVYLDYIRSASLPMFITFLVTFAVYQGFQMLRSFWLSAWSNENDPAYEGEKMDQVTRLCIYIALGTIESIGFLFSLAFLLYAGLNASRRLHAPLIHNLMRSPVSFFDTTPLGRILNRCSKDIETIDSQLPMNTKYFVMCIYSIITTLLVIVISTPLFIVVIIPLALIYVLFLRFYVPTSRQLKRLESVNRSPVYSHFGESIQGAASIRAYGRVGEFCLASEEKVDTFIRCRYLNTVSNRWLAVRLEFIGNCVIFFAALFATFSKEWNWGVSAGLVGVSVSYALNITEVLNFAVRQISDVEANIVSVERVKEYSETPNEAEWVIETKRPPTEWPVEGGVKLINYSTRYRPGLDLVLKNINADVKKGEKIGIVGRTGAGKSSFALALFRMIEPAGGSINIDGLDTVDMGLHDLRKKLTIIPQDPVLFSGTLRFNLDPFGEYSDDALWNSLRFGPFGVVHEYSHCGIGSLDI